MGITGFAKFVKETWPEAVNETNLNNYKIEGRIAVDGNNEAYVYMHTCKVITIKELDNENVMRCIKDTEYRKDLYNKIRILWMQKIIEFVFTDLKGDVVWVIDGKNIPCLKSDVRDERRERIETSRKSFEDYSKCIDDDFPDPVMARSKLMDYMCSIPPKKADYDLLVYVLHRTGIPVIRAWGEGEKTCARLCREDVPESIRCNVVWSADVDSVLFGAPVLIQRIKRSKAEYEERNGLQGTPIRVIDSSKLDIDMNLLIDMCIATGCDYYKKGISRLGLKSTYKLVTKGEPIPKIPETESLNSLFQHGPEEVYEVLKPVPPQEPDMVKERAKWLINIYHK